jgi:outer membrane protein OmpA-like peptidoglycan-associated protein
MKCKLVLLSGCLLVFCFGCARFQSKKTPDLLEESKFLRKISESGNYTGSAYFEVYSSALNISGEDTLADIAQLQAVLNAQIHLSGHSDKTGEKTFNIVLSSLRAESAKKYLLGLGVEEEHIHMQYFGDSMPAVDEETLEAYAKNRRVDIELKIKERDTLVK